MTSEVADSSVPCLTVQRCLLVTEVVQRIVQYAAQDSSKDVVALSTTCRALHNSAQDEIWGSLTDLRALVMCFPGAIWEQRLCPDTGWHVLAKRPPKPTEWDRFLANAARVRSLMVSTGAVRPSMTLLHWLPLLAVHRPVLDLFPNIQHLEWRDEPWKQVSGFASLFVGDKLRTFKLKWGSNYDTLDGAAPLVTWLTQKARSLREVRLDLQDDLDTSDCLNDDILSLVSANQLEVLKINVPLSLSEFAKLAQSRTLKSMEVKFMHTEISFYGAECAHAPSSPDHGSSPHRTLADSSVDLSPGESPHVQRPCVLPNSQRDRQFLPQTATTSSLEELIVRRGDREHSSQRVRSIFVAIADDPSFSNLRRFAFFPPPGPSSHWASRAYLRRRLPHPDVWSRSRIDSDICNPLLGMKTLTHLHITSNYLELGDQDIHDLTSDLPQLESLLLLPEFYHDGDSRNITMNGLWCAAHHAPNLRELGLHVDFAARNRRLPVERRNMTCKRLDFADSLLPSWRASQVAAYLRDLFGHPELEIHAFRSEYPVHDNFQRDRTPASERQKWRTCLERVHSSA